MKLLKVENGEEYWMANYQGIPICIKRVISTDEIFFEVNGLAKVLGYKDQTELLSSDEGLDFINEFMKRNPGKPIFGDGGFFQR